MHDLGASHAQCGLRAGAPIPALAQLGNQIWDANIRRPMPITANGSVALVPGEAHLEENVEEPSTLRPEEPVRKQMKRISWCRAWVHARNVVGTPSKDRALQTVTVQALGCVPCSAGLSDLILKHL